MREAEARTVLLVKAIETTDPEGKLLSQAQRQGASDIVRAGLPRSSRHQNHRDWAERFLVKRAERLLQEAAAQRSSFLGLLEPSTAWRIASSVLVLLAFLAGSMSETLAEPGRINLLSLPLMGLLLWNWAMLLLWLVSRALRLRRRRPGRGYAALSNLVALPGRWRRWGLGLARQFGQDWMQSGAPLLQARMKALLHLGAAALALGMILNVLVKALPNEFGVGWESQLLKTPGQVHAFLSVLFLPATLLYGITGIEPFTLEEIAAMHRWSASSAEHADRWLRLVAVLLVVTVILPRLVLGLLQWRRARRLARDFPIDLTDPYFGRLLSSEAGLQYRLVVWPYSFTLEGNRAQALSRAAGELFGAGTGVDLRPATRYGASLDVLSRKADRAPDGGVVETAGLLALSATPETETHGAFLDRLGEIAGGNALLLLDSASFVRKLGEHDRLRERLSLWTDFAQRHGVKRIHVVNLGDRDE